MFVCLMMDKYIPCLFLVAWVTRFMILGVFSWKDDLGFYGEWRENWHGLHGEFQVGQPDKNPTMALNPWDWGPGPGPGPLWMADFSKDLSWNNRICAP